MEADKIRKAIIAIIQGQIPLNSTWGKVKSVSGQFCTVIIDELEVKKILLGFDKSGVIVYPKLNTDVLIVFTDNTRTRGAVVVVKETDRIEIMGSANGGLVISDKAKEQYNKIEQSLNDLKQVFIAWTPVSQDGGAALKTAIATWMADPLIETQASDIESNKVKHGNG